MGEAAKEADLVIDEAEGGAGLMDVVEHGLEIADLVAPEAGGRLVEKQELRLAHEGHGDAEHLLLAVGEIARELVGRPSEIAEGEHLAHPRGQTLLDATRDPHDFQPRGAAPARA